MIERASRQTVGIPTCFTRKLSTCFSPYAYPMQHPNKRRQSIGIVSSALHLLLSIGVTANGGSIVPD